MSTPKLSAEVLTAINVILPWIGQDDAEMDRLRAKIDTDTCTLTERHRLLDLLDHRDLRLIAVTKRLGDGSFADILKTQRAYLDILIRIASKPARKKVSK